LVASIVPTPDRVTKVDNNDKAVNTALPTANPYYCHHHHPSPSTIIADGNDKGDEWV
jgi:hypothetical protein